MSIEVTRQIRLDEVNDEYEQFLNKFKPKKTTDDCYTPPNIYEAVLEWVTDEYAIGGREIVRPFWPGGDYERFDYPDGCVVVDNPPFSILAEIIMFYLDNGIDYFLFAPYLTNFTAGAEMRNCHIIAPVSVIYENGAEISTSFVTSLDKVYKVRACPSLHDKIKEADKINRKNQKKQLPKYKYPPEVITATAVGYIASHGIRLDIKKEDVMFIRALESQKSAGKGLFGSGFILSERAAAERAAAERDKAQVWKLSEREWDIVKSLGRLP